MPGQQINRTERYTNVGRKAILPVEFDPPSPDELKEILIRMTKNLNTLEPEPKIYKNRAEAIDAFRKATGIHPAKVYKCSNCKDHGIIIKETKTADKTDVNVINCPKCYKYVIN